MYHPGAPRLVTGLLVGLSVALIFTACRQNTPAPTQIVSSATAATSEFLGNAACVECHKKEFEAHKGSHHDLTMRIPTRESLQNLVPPTGTVPLAGYSFEEQNELRDSLELGTRPPSSRMIWRALKIAREQNVLLTPEILESFERTRGFLIAYSRDDGPSR